MFLEGSRAMATSKVLGEEEKAAENVYIKVKQKTLIIWGEDDQIVSNKLGVRLHCELPDAIIHQIPDCGHLPHVERPSSVAKLILEFIRENCKVDAQSLSHH